MRFFRAFLIFLLVLPTAASGQLLGFGPSGGALSNVTCNAGTGLYTSLVNGSGTCTSPAATCNGATDDSAAFNRINTWLVAWGAAHPGHTIEVDIPHGVTCVLSSGTNCNANTNILDGLVLPSKGLVVGLGFGGQGDGATLTDGGNTTLSIGSCGHGANQSGGQCYAAISDASAGCSSRIATVSAGATCVNLVTGDSGLSLATLAARFTVGHPLLIGGIDIQGSGAPTNNWLFEWNTVASKSSTLQCDGMTSGASVALGSALANQYLSTWALFYGGNSTGGIPDAGGPATIWDINPNWNTSQEYRGLTINTAGQGTANGHDITFRNVKFTGGTGGCWIPSQNGSWSLINTDASACSLEIDKLVASAAFNGTHVHSLAFQSGYKATISVVNSSTLDVVTGTSGTFVCANSTLTNLALGAYAQGLSTTFTGTNCSIPTLSLLGYTFPSVKNFYTMSGGIITIPNQAAVTARGAGAGSLVRLTLNCQGQYTTLYGGCSPTSQMATGQQMWIGAAASNCSADVPLANYTINVIDTTHIDLQGTTYTSGTAVTAGCVTISGPNSGASFPPIWAVPGGNLVWTCSPDVYCPPAAQITSVTQDANATYVHTSLGGGFPSPPGTLGIITHPAPSFTCTGCTGAGVAPLVGTAGGPVGSYWSLAINSSNTPVTPISPLWGTLATLVFNVTSSAGGGETVDINNMGPPFWINAAGTARTTYNTSETMASVHTCTVTPTTATGCTNATAPGSALWALSGQIGPELAGGTAGVATVTITTNQGTVAGP